ncbi:hypothetical protein D9M68_616710 [compost metagenome]
MRHLASSVHRHVPYLRPPEGQTAEMKGIIREARIESAMRPLQAWLAAGGDLSDTTDNVRVHGVHS